MMNFDSIAYLFGCAFIVIIGLFLVIGFIFIGAYLVAATIDWCFSFWKKHRPPCKHEYVVEYDEDFNPYLKCKNCLKIKQIKDVE